jgi:hypothetical protein
MHQLDLFSLTWAGFFLAVSHRSQMCELKSFCPLQAIPHYSVQAAMS